MKKTFKLIFSNIVLFVGVGLFVSGIFSFESKSNIGGFGNKNETNSSNHYYYSDYNISKITIGFIFITFGILKNGIK